MAVSQLFQVKIERGEEDDCPLVDTPVLEMEPKEFTDVIISVYVDLPDIKDTNGTENEKAVIQKKTPIAYIKAHSQILALYNPYFRSQPKPMGSSVYCYDFRVTCDEKDASIHVTHLLMSVLKLIYLGCDSKDKEIEQHQLEVVCSDPTVFTYLRGYVIIMNALQVPISKALFQQYVKRQKGDPSSSVYSVGQRVTAKYKGNGTFDAIITSVQDDGKFYGVLYVDGDSDPSVLANHINVEYTTPTTEYLFLSTYSFDQSPKEKLATFMYNLEPIVQNLEHVANKESIKSFILSCIDNLLHFFLITTPWLIDSSHIDAFKKVSGVKLFLNDTHDECPSSQLIIQPRISNSTLVFAGTKYYDANKMLNDFFYSKNIVTTQEHKDFIEKYVLDIGLGLINFSLDSTRLELLDYLKFAVAKNLPQSIKYANSIFHKMQFQDKRVQVKGFNVLKDLEPEHFMLLHATLAC